MRYLGIRKADTYLFHFPPCLGEQGKVVWIVGCSSGIGEHLAWTCSSNGARVILSARRENELRRVASQCAGMTTAVVLWNGWELLLTVAGVGAAAHRW